MCKEAVASDRHHFAQAMNTSILFMLGMVLTVFVSFVGVVWFSYRNARRRAERGETFAPEGKLRWTAAEDGPADRR
jgi:hypothetical protein